MTQSDSTFRLYFPLTLRGLSLLALAIYCLMIPVRLKSDIIAAAFSICALASLGLFVGLALLSIRRLKKSIKIELSSGTSSEQSVSDVKNLATEAVAVVTKISGITISPFFELRFRYKFKQAGITPRIHSLKPSCPTETFIVESIIFPHRGNWLLEGVSLDLIDRLGFIKVPLPFAKLNQILSIEPKPFHCPRWPILASTIRVDDQVNHPVERKGDLYDLKQYHPADGARKIVWKIFAKSGQLFSRYPEPAYSPEGKVAILCLAKKSDDKLASEVIAYLEELENHEIEILFSTLASDPKIATDMESGKQLLIEEAWSAEGATIEDVHNAIETLISEAKGHNSERVVQSLVIAISEASLKDSNYVAMIEACQLLLSKSQIRSSIFISSALTGSFMETSGISKNSLSGTIKKYLIESSTRDTEPLNPKKAQAFISSINPAQSDLSWS